MINVVNIFKVKDPDEEVLKENLEELNEKLKDLQIRLKFMIKELEGLL